MCPNFGCAGMVIELGAPCVLDSRFGSGDASARLACNNDLADSGLAQIDVLLSGYLRQVKRIGRCAAKHGCLKLNQAAQPLIRILRSAGDGESADLFRPGPSCPESDKGAEGKGKKDAVTRSDSGGTINGSPTPRPPVPALPGVKPA